MSRQLDPYRPLLDQFASAAEVLAWTDEQAESDYRDRVAHLRAAVAALKKSKTPQAAYSRARFAAELARVHALLAVDRSVEQERAAFLAAATAAGTATAAVEVALSGENVDALLRARAVLDLASRKAQNARAAFITASLARKLPSLSVEYGPMVQCQANQETRDVARHAADFANAEQGYTNHAADVVQAHGRAAANMGRVAPSVVYWAVAESDYVDSTEADKRAIFDARWEVAAKVLGLAQTATAAE
jgi:hypothetical protein